MRIAGVLTASFANGEGVRYVIFTQGCFHGCPECHNPETHSLHGGYHISVEELAEDIKNRKHLDGITLSGGEPFLQQEECLRLINLLHGMNVWIYTGYEYEDIEDEPLAKKADAIVCGPYIKELRCEGKHYGSSNQRIVRRNKDE